MYVCYVCYVCCVCLHTVNTHTQAMQEAMQEDHSRPEAVSDDHPRRSPRHIPGDPDSDSSEDEEPLRYTPDPKVEFIVYQRHAGGVKFWVKVGHDWAVGGPGTTCQDKVSLSSSPERSRGMVVKIDRFQVLKTHRAKGYGRLIMSALITLYAEFGASMFIVPSPTPPGRKFYRKCGFTKGPIWLYELKI
jgi:GNAT superfamily N-acetyltransferase